MALNLTADVDDFLARHHVMTLATHGAQGPWAAALFYARQGDDLIFVSSPTSRHCSDCAVQPRCAATIQAQPQDWSGIQGVQVEGEVSELQGDERGLARQRYEERFPFARPGGAVAQIAAALARVRWYRLRITRLYFIDNRRGFGQRQQFDNVP